MARVPETRDRILDAADALFAEQGFAAVSVRDIAERAGVTKALVFYHFESKAKLFGGVVEGYYARHAEALVRGAAGGGDRREKLHRMLDAYLDFLEENRRYVALVQREIAAGSEAMAPIRKGLSSLYRWVAENLKGLAPETGPLSARQIFVSFSGLATTYYLYAPVMEEIFGEDPMSVAGRRERRDHLHWMVNRTLEGLEAERRQAGRKGARKSAV